MDNNRNDARFNDKPTVRSWSRSVMVSGACPRLRRILAVRIGVSGAHGAVFSSKVIGDDVEDDSDNGESSKCFPVSARFPGAFELWSRSDTRGCTAFRLRGSSSSTTWDGAFVVEACARVVISCLPRAPFEAFFSTAPVRYEHG